MTIDIIIAAVVAAIGTGIIEFFRRRNQVTMPVLEEECNGQAYKYVISNTETSFVGYSNERYSADQLILYALVQLHFALPFDVEVMEVNE